MNIFRKIQNLPEDRKKIILWLVVIIVGLALFIFYVKSVQKRIKSLEREKIEEELRLPKLEEELEGMPKFEVPKIKEELKGLEEIIEEETYEK